MSLRLLLLLLCFVPMSAWAAKMPGIRLYERGEYAKASRSLTAELKNPRRSEEDRARARVYLAASLLALKKTNEARQQLEALALSTAEPQVDPALFPPELVEMEKQVRGGLQAERVPPEPDQAELNRLAAAEDAERREREQEEAARKQVAVEPRNEVRGTAPTETVSSFRLRPEVIGFSDFAGLIAPPGKSSIGFGLGVSAGSGMFDGSARALFGDRSLGVELDAGLVLGNGAFQPRVGLRGTLIQGFTGSNAFGGGGAVGARLALSPKLTALLDVSGQAFSVPEGSGYKSFVLMGSAGVGFNLL